MPPIFYETPFFSGTLEEWMIFLDKYTLDEVQVMYQDMPKNLMEDIRPYMKTRIWKHLGISNAE
jgi:hypothetical protein